MLMTFSKSLSNSLSEGLQHLIKTFDIDVYIIPPDVTIELSFTKADLAMDTSNYPLETLSAVDDSVTESEVGLYGPQFSEVGFWIVAVLYSMFLAVVVSITVYQYYKEKERKKLTVYKVSFQSSFDKLAEERKTGTLADSGDPYDTKMIDGLRVLCLIWTLSLGVCQFTMSSAV
jgi:hypothetical protein